MKSINIDVPSDLSSCAFFSCRSNCKNSFLKIKNINNNPTRNGILLALKRRTNIELLNNRKVNNENICDIEVKF